MAEEYVVNAKGEKVPHPGWRISKNGARLLAGGMPGNKGGTSYTSAVRKACANGFASGVPLIAKIANGEPTPGNPCPDYRDIIAAWQALGKYGVGEIQTVMVNDDDVAKAAIKVVQRMFGSERLSEFSMRLVNEVEQYGLGGETYGDDE